MKSGMRRGTLTAVLVMVLSVSGVQSAAPVLAHGTDFFPKVIDLPNGFQPEGISIGRGTSFYVGSLEREFPGYFEALLTDPWV